MSELGPLDHISRQALPWRREPDLTECGRRIADLNNRVVTRETIAKRIQDIGQQRAAFTTCMTCVNKSDQWGGADPDQAALLAVGREVTAVEHSRPPLAPEAYAIGRHWSNLERDQAAWERRQRLTSELRAIAVLVETHREEFDNYLADLKDTVALADRRRNRQAPKRYLGGAS